MYPFFRSLPPILLRLFLCVCDNNFTIFGRTKYQSRSENDADDEKDEGEAKNSVNKNELKDILRDIAKLNEKDILEVNFAIILKKKIEKKNLTI